MADQDLLTRSASTAATAPAGRALPSNLQAEAAFLGAVLIDNRLLEELTVPVRPEHFFVPVHQRVFERVLALMDRQMVVTPVTLKPYFEADEALAELRKQAEAAGQTVTGITKTQVSGREARKITLKGAPNQPSIDALWIWDTDLVWKVTVSSIAEKQKSPVLTSELARALASFQLLNDAER